MRAKAAQECRRTKPSDRVYFSKRRYPRIIDHFRDAVRDGHPRVLHIARDQADENRDEALDHWEDTEGDRYTEAEREGKDRDEYPPAASREGGRYRGGYADVRLLDSGENRSAGARLGGRLRPYRNGQPYRLAVSR